MKDIFNTTFFFLLGIVVIAAAVIYLYFENKLKDSAHKLNSMLNLVTSVTEEVRQIQYFISIISKNNPSPTSYAVNKVNAPQGGSQLIEVSENEDEDDEESSDEDEDDDESSDEDEDEEDKDEDQVKVDETKNKEEVEEDVNNETKLLKIDLNSSDHLGNNMDDLEEDDSDSSSLDSKLEIISIPEIADINEMKNNIDIEINNDLDMNTSEEKIKYVIDPFNDTVDYKKLSVYNLRSIVKQKGLVEDPSKMKKQDLLKLLSIE